MKVFENHQLGSKSLQINSNSNFKPTLIEQIGQGGHAAVFKARFHGQEVAMKYIPLDKNKKSYEYKPSSYGIHEYANQVQFKY